MLLRQLHSFGSRGGYVRYFLSVCQDDARRASLSYIRSRSRGLSPALGTVNTSGGAFFSTRTPNDLPIRTSEADGELKLEHFFDISGGKVPVPIGDGPRKALANTTNRITGFTPQKLDGDVDIAYQAGKSMKVLELIKHAKLSGASLSPAVCSKAIFCCAKVAVTKACQPSEEGVSKPLPDHSERKTVLAELVETAVALLDIASREERFYSAATIQALKVCIAAKDPDTAIKIFRKCEGQANVSHYDIVLGEYTKALCTVLDLLGDGQPNDEPTRLLMMACDAFESYMRYKDRHNLKAEDDSVYLAAVRVYCHLLGRERVSVGLIDLLNGMTRDGFEPSRPMCRTILGNALRAKNTKLIKVMLQWFYVHFDYPLEEGAVSAALEHAVRVGDLELGKLAVRSREKSYSTKMRETRSASEDALSRPGASSEASGLLGRNGVTAWDYATLIMIAVKDKNISVAIELLAEADEVGVDIYCVPYAIAVWEQFVHVCSQSVKQNDILYYALLEMRRQSPDRRAPRLALNTVVAASGRSGFLDRAFATFSEFSDRFGVTPDVHSYNSLLYAVSRSKAARVSLMVTILKDMDTKGINPNDMSYSYFFDVVSERKSLEQLRMIRDSLLDVVRSKGIRPRMRSIRRLAYAAGERNMLELVEELKRLMFDAIPIGPSEYRGLTHRIPPSKPLLFFSNHLEKKLKPYANNCKNVAMVKDISDAKEEIKLRVDYDKDFIKSSQFECSMPTLGIENDSVDDHRYS